MPVAGNRAALALIGLMVSDFPPEHETGYWEGATPGETGVPGSLADFVPATMTARQANSMRVQQAYDALKAMGVSAFPDLVANSADERYSFSTWEAAWCNYTVGDACFMIVVERADFWGYGYKSRDLPGGRVFMKPRFLYEIRRTTGLKAWWEARKDWSVAEMQMEAVKWTIEKEQAAGFVDDAQRHLVLDPLKEKLKELEREVGK